jgi:site-specific DNA-methyltransferase (cytosine-N4-specific)
MKKIKISYKTNFGQMINGSAESVLNSPQMRRFENKVQLIFTSPPFPLNRKKKYGNLNGDDYKNWLASFAPIFTKYLKKNGSIVMEMGNAWEPGKPVMSTLALESLLEFKNSENLNLCEQFVCFNPARLPSPAQWVNVERIRVKDSFTYVWWFSPVERPKANNRRILQGYSPSMLRLLETKKYNSGKRPSEHHIGKKSFLANNKGAIPANVLTISNTISSDKYRAYCEKNEFPIHPARMPSSLAEFFIKFLTNKNDLVLDPFGGSNTTGAMAEQLKRRWVSIEPSKDFIQGSRGRFEKFNKSPKRK